MPSMPLASKSSMMRFCSAAVPSEGILNSTEVSANSSSAFSVPLRAIVQKSEALLVTKASFLPDFCPQPTGNKTAKASNNPKNNFALRFIKMSLLWVRPHPCGQFSPASRTRARVLNWISFTLGIVRSIPPPSVERRTGTTRKLRHVLQLCLCLRRNGESAYRGNDWRHRHRGQSASRG
jgi:hypothetical protein